MELIQLLKREVFIVSAMHVDMHQVLLLPLQNYSATLVGHAVTTLGMQWSYLIGNFSVATLDRT